MKTIDKYLLGFFLSFCGHTASACDCLGTKSVEESVKGSDIVVSATILSEETWYVNNDLDSGLFVKDRRPGNYVEAQSRFRVLIKSKLKGHFNTDTLTIVSLYGEVSCGVEFVIGKTYIIYGRSDISIGLDKSDRLLNTFETDFCSRTRLENDQELADIKKYTGH